MSQQQRPKQDARVSYRHHSRTDNRHDNFNLNVEKDCCKKSEVVQSNKNTSSTFSKKDNSTYNENCHQNQRSKSLHVSKSDKSSKLAYKSGTDDYNHQNENKHITTSLNSNNSSSNLSLHIAKYEDSVESGNDQKAKEKSSKNPQIIKVGEKANEIVKAVSEPASKQKEEQLPIPRQQEEDYSSQSESVDFKPSQKLLGADSLNVNREKGLQAKKRSENEAFEEPFKFCIDDPLSMEQVPEIQSQNDVYEIIENFVDNNEMLDFIQNYFISNFGKKVNEKDLKLIEAKYDQYFMKSLPDKFKIFINDIIANGDQNVIIKWISVIYENGTAEDMLELLKTAKFYEALNICFQKLDKFVLSANIQKFKTEFKKTFVNSMKFEGLLGIYRCLLYCQINTKRSQIFCDAFNKLCKKLYNIDAVLVPEIENEDAEHILLAKLVENFVLMPSENEKVFQILEMFKPWTFKIENKIFEISAYELSFSEVAPEFYKRYDASMIDEIRICTVQSLTLDENFTFPGKNLSIISRELIFSQPLTCDLSGETSADDDFNHAAKSGKKYGENGEDGKDGKAGKSSGNLVIYASKIVNEQNFNVILNGSNGSDGQNGGNGANGQDGSGQDFRKKFDSEFLLTRSARSLMNLSYAGIPGRLSSKNVNTKDYFLVENTYICSLHRLELFYGTEGTKGGRGGKNGNGGEGGKKGICIVKCQNEMIPLTKVSAVDGMDGKCGKPGKNGDDGMDGWEIGIVCKSLGTPLEYGKHHNEKFEIQYTDKYAPDTVYVPQRYKNNRSDCYARIIPRQNQHQILQESKKAVESEYKIERKGDAISRQTNDISIEAIEQKFEEICHAEKGTEIEQQEEVQSNQENEIEVSRLLEPSYSKEEVPYISNLCHQNPSLSPHVLESFIEKRDYEKIWLNPITSDCCEILQQKLEQFDQTFDDQVKEKFKKKIILSTLRQNQSHYSIDEKYENDVSEITENLETILRNFAPYLEKIFDVQNDFVVASLGNNSDLIQEAVENIEILPVTTFLNYVELFTELEKIEVCEMPIYESKLVLEDIFKGINISKDFLAAIENTVITERKTINKLIAKLDSNDEIFKEWSKLPEFFQNETFRLLSFFPYLYEKVVSNRVLAEALCLCVKAQADEKQLDENPQLFGESATIMNWLNIANDENVCNSLLTRIFKNGTKCAAGRLLLAWKTKANIRIYNNGSLIEDHLPWHIDNVQHFEINEKTGEFQVLVVNKNLIALEKERMQKAISFNKNLKVLEDDYECELISESLNFMALCSNCQIKEQYSSKSSQNMKTKVIKLLSFFGSNSDALYSRLELLCLEFPSIGFSFVDTLITVFEIDGCHIDLNIFKYLFETVFLSSQKYGTQHKDFFASVLFSTSQSNWINEFLIYNAEIVLKTLFPKKDEVRENLLKIVDANIKILFSHKLQSQKLTIYSFLTILDLMQYCDGIYRELENVELTEWAAVIKDYQFISILKSKKTSFLNQAQRDLVLFWCSKLVNHFEKDVVEKLYRFLGHQQNYKFALHEKDFGHLVESLCNNQICCDLTSSTLIGIFAAALCRQEISGQNVENVLITENDKNVVNEIFAKNSIYKTEEWMKLLRNCNELSKLPGAVRDLFATHDPLKNAVHECVQKLCNTINLTSSKCMKIIKGYFEKLGSNSTDFDFFLLEIVTKVIRMQRGFGLRLNQKVAALCAIKSKNGLLQQLATGEGKSLIITAVAIINVLKGKHVNIISSSSTLAKRDIECSDPVGCVDIYQTFGIKASHICIDSSNIRAERYSSNEIIYGDLTSFQRDYLLDTFYSMNIVGSRKFDTVIVDEVDSMLLDQGSNMLYLSHEIPELEALQATFVKIWYTVNANIDDKNGFDDETIFNIVYSNLFEGNDEETNIPKHLQNYVKLHLKEFISNAKEAIFMEEGVHYEVDVVHSNVSIVPQHKIIIIDQGTGVDLPTTQWSNGLHQFLQLKHAVKLVPISTKAVFISNVSFLKKFEKLFGFTGTLGSKAERQQLENIYDIQCLTLPSSFPKQFYEKPGIVASNESTFVSEIFESIKHTLNLNRSVLVICESIKQATILNTKIKAIAKEKLLKDEQKSFIDACVYRRDYEQFIYGDGTARLGTQKIIFATNLAGRGTDIQLSTQLRKAGGLHVIVAFLPENLRIEEQAFGRAARNCDPGTAQLIVLADEEDFGANANLNISKLKFKRNAQEIRKLKNTEKCYKEKIFVEEECFQHFIQKFKNIKTSFETRTLTEMEEKLMLKDLLDQWSLFLDQLAYKELSGEQRVQAAKCFCQNLNSADGSKEFSLSQPMNVIKYAIIKAISGDYDTAEKLLRRFDDKNSTYSAEACYYLAYVKAKTSPTLSKNYKEIETLLEKAKKGFEKRVSGYYNDRTIIEHYRNDEENGLLKTNAFSQQQFEMIQLTNLFIKSIDEFLGGRIDPTDFTNQKIAEETSGNLHKYFGDPNVFNDLPISVAVLKDEYDPEILENFCQERGISVRTMMKALKNFKDGKIDKNELTNSVNPPTVEKFWKNLKDKNLIVNVKKHLFFDISKLSYISAKLGGIFQSLQLNDSNGQMSNYKIFEHSFVLNSTWKELDLEKFINGYSKELQDELLEHLQELGVILFTESGELLEKSSEEALSISFDEFSSISAKDFLLSEFDENEAAKMIADLVEKGILHEKSSGIFQLAAIDINKSYETLPSKVQQIINQKFAFVLTYRKLQQSLSEKKALAIQLPTFKKSSPIFDLIDLGIFEQSNVNLAALFANAKTANSMEKGFNCIWSNEAYSNISNALKHAEKAKAVQRFKTPEARLIPVADKLAECNLLELGSTSLMTKYGPSHLLVFGEQKWSKRTIQKLACVTTGAFIQLALGGVILIGSCGSGVFVANVLRAEGISDLIYAIKGAYSGYADSYREHKRMSLMTNSILYGVGGFFARGGKMNPIAYAIKGGNWTSASGVNHMELKGAALIADVTMGRAVKEVTKQVVLQVGTSLMDLALFNALQNFLQTAINVATAAAKQKIIGEFKSIFKNLASTKELLTKVFCEIGIVEGEKLINECAKRVFYGKEEDMFAKICNFVFLKYRNLFINFVNGVVSGQNHCGNISSKWMQNLVHYLPTIFLIGQWSELVLSMKNIMKSYLKEIEKLIKIQLESKKKNIALFKQFTPLSKNNFEPPKNEDIEKAVKSVIKGWHTEIKGIVHQILESRVTVPLLALTTSKIQQKVEQLISHCYYSMKEKMDLAKLKKLEKIHNASKDFTDREKMQEAHQRYEEQLMKVLKNTRSPKVYAKILCETVKIDQTGAAAIANLISHELKQHVIVHIKNEDGETFTHESGKEYENVKEYTFNLGEQHFGDEIKEVQVKSVKKDMFSAENEQEIKKRYKNMPKNESEELLRKWASSKNGFVSTTRNSCLYNEVIKQVPDLATRFKDDESFREGLAFFISHDPYFRQHIRNGWHSIAIEKGLIGGKCLPLDDINELDRLIRNNPLANETVNKYYKMVKASEKFIEKFEKDLKSDFNEEKIEDIKEQIRKVKNMHAVGHKNRKELQKKQQISKDLLDECKQLMKSYISEKSSLSWSEQMSICSLYIYLGEKEEAWKYTFYVDWIPYKLFKYPNLTKAVEDWNKYQEQCLSEEFIQELKDAHDTGNDQKYQRTQKGELCQNIADLATIFYEGKNNLFVTSISSNDETTLYISANYYRGLNDKKKNKLIQDIIKIYKANLEANGIKTIKWIERDPASQPYVIPHFLWETVKEIGLEPFKVAGKAVRDKKISIKKLLRMSPRLVVTYFGPTYAMAALNYTAVSIGDMVITGKFSKIVNDFYYNFEHDGHAEMQHVAYHKKMAKSNSSADFPHITMAGGHGSCLNCLAYCDNNGIRLPIVPGEVEAENERCLHPDDIKVVVKVSKPID